MVKSNTDGAARPSKTSVAKKRTNTQAVAPLKPQKTLPNTKPNVAEGTFPYHVKEMVFVEPRTWPGMNKPGGIGRIIRVRLDAQTVDVKYVLGGSEKNVQLKYISKKDKDSRRKRESIKTDFYHNKYVERHPRIALSLKEKEVQEKKGEKD